MGLDRYVIREQNVCTCAVASFVDVEVCGVRVISKYHVADAVGDKVVGVRRKVVEELKHVVVRVFCKRGLLLGKSSQCYKGFIFEYSGLVLDGADELLDAQLACRVERCVCKTWSPEFGNLLKYVCNCSDSAVVPAPLGSCSVSFCNLTKQITSSLRSKCAL